MYQQSHEQQMKQLIPNQFIFRSRAAFKLIEINDKYKILRPGHLVVDCGCSPGAWTQVAVRETESVKRHRSLPQGLVIGVDLQHTYPIEV